MKCKSSLLVLLVVWFGAQVASATHNRAGEITYVQIDELTVEATITTYTKESSVNVDRDSLVINWGDGSSNIVFRVNGNGRGVSLGNDIKKNVYVGRHTYPGRGTYTISVEDPNRIADILNIPNSVNVKFFLFARLTLLNGQFQGGNSGVQLLEPPIDAGCVGQPFIHNPNAYDEDGDSLSFKLIPPFQAKDSAVSGYVLPSGVLPGPANEVFLDENTGEFTWLFPPREGDYNIAIEISEFREGVLINTMIRDMQIQIFECDNNPPQVEAPDELCVIAGDTISFEVFASDPDVVTDLVRLTATGGPFNLQNNPATFNGDSSFASSPVGYTFSWATTCNHVREEPYLVVFKAEDAPPRPPSLTDVHTLQIKVVAPPPLDLQSSAQGDVVQLDWNLPYACEDADDDYFYGFSIWRQRRSIPFQQDTCFPGLEGRGYELIRFGHRDVINDRYVFFDSTASRGITYCYRVQAEFARYTSLGNPYNFVPSLASEEVCIQLSRDQPLITHVDIQSTDDTNGSILVKWVRPIPEDLDTLLRPGPYIYTLERKREDMGGFFTVPGAQFIGMNWSSPVDSQFIDQGLNTRDYSFEYQVKFTYGGLPSFRTSEPASSIFVNAIATDRAIQLTWDEEVPWSNIRYYILRQNIMGGEDTVGVTNEQQFKDTGLNNGESYCYRVASEGSYAIDRTPTPLINHSQRICAIPIDTVGPCAPVILVENDCEFEDSDDNDFFNYITWNDITSDCENASDVASIVIFYRDIDTSPWRPLDTVPFGRGFTYSHQPVGTSSGCYAVIAIDSVGNSSDLSNLGCLENCPLYVLPNVFTPDGNGQNDLFTPRIKRFIERVEFEVYNRWGSLVFKTQDPVILWDGRNMNGAELSDGTYFYVCRVFEKRFDGVFALPEALSGYIELRRQ